MATTLILLRGLPGAGKTTLANLLSEKKWPVFSVDDYFTNPQTKEYTFEFEKNHLAYAACQNQTENAMKQGLEKIFVANTFTMDWELAPYFALSLRYNYKVFVATVENYHQQANLHNVSEEQLQKMAAKYKVKLL